MARRRRSKNDDGGAGALLFLLVALVAILILAASVVGTVAIFFVAIRNYWRVRELPYASSMQDFALTDREGVQLLEAAMRIRKAEEAEDDAYARGDGRSKREDKLFIARGIGIELNEIILNARAEAHRARVEAQEIQSLPEWRANLYIELRAAAVAGAVGVLVFGVAFLLLLVTALPAVVAYAGWLEGYMPTQHAAELSHLFASASLACVLGWAAYGLGKLMFAGLERRRLEQATTVA